MSYYSGQLEPMVPTPLQRGLAYIVDYVFVTLGLGALVLLAGGLTSVTLAAFLVGHAVYYVGPTIVFGGTPAKLMSGLRVRLQDGSPVSPDAAILRYLVFALTVFWVPLGVIITLAFLVTNPERLALHDRIAKTIVMYRD